jgi:glycosyltransferase involved in cell wall biosynthesis
MTHVLHLIDEAGHGDVTRVLADQLPRLAERFPPRVHTVTSGWRLPGRIDAGIIVVHFTLCWSKLLFLIALWLRNRGVPLVIVEHAYTAAYEQQCVRHRRGFRALLRFCYRLADRVVAVSHSQADWLCRAGLVPAGRLVTIPQACDTAAVAALPPVPAAPRPLRLGAYGRCGRQKGFDVLIEAMCRVSPGLATLELVGYGPGRADLQAAAAGLPHVRISGPVNGPAGLLARVDAVVIPSRWEAFGVAAAEARAAGRPVIASRTDGLIEQVDPSWGLLVDPEDPDRLAEAIEALAARNLTTMGEAGRQSVATALDDAIAHWDMLLGDLAGEGDAATAAAPATEHAPFCMPC